MYKLLLSRFLCSTISRKILPSLCVCLGSLLSLSSPSVWNWGWKSLPCCRGNQLRTPMECSVSLFNSIADMHCLCILFRSTVVTHPATHVLTTHTHAHTPHAHTPHAHTPHAHIPHTHMHTHTWYTYKHTDNCLVLQADLTPDLIYSHQHVWQY